jgi:hypothetical protein
MEEERVKVVFEFDRKDYENYLFLLNQEPDEETEQAWDVMTSEEVIISKELIARNLGMSKKELLVIFASLAVTWAEEKIKSTK